MARGTRIVLISDITKFGSVLANSLRARLSWSRKLRGKVKLGKSTERNGIVSIDVTIAEGDKNLSGMARAFAWGSGEKATRGKNRGRYLIPGKPFLQFKGTNKFEGKIVRVKEVWHPGVESKGYVDKAIETTLARATPELKAAIRRNLVNELRLAIKGTK